MIMKLAVIGLGFGKKHARSILSEAVNAELVAVADIDNKQSIWGKEWNVPFYQDYKEMIRKQRPDGVIVAVPPHMHSEVGIECACLGVHLFIEKPITNTIEEADELLQEVERNNVQLLIGHNQRFDPSVEKAKEHFLSEQLVGFHVFSVLSKAPSYFSQDWRKKREFGGGPLVSNGIHDIDRIRYICGDIKRVTASKANKVRGYEVEDTVAVSIECANGAVGTLYLSDCSHPIMDYTDYYFGTDSSIMFDCPTMYGIEGRHRFQKVEWEDIEKSHPERKKIVEGVEFPLVDTHCQEIEHFCKVIQGLEQPKTPGEDAKKTLTMLLAIIQSADTNKPVDICNE